MGRFRFFGWGLLVVAGLLAASLGVVSTAAGQAVLPATPTGITVTPGRTTASVTWQAGTPGNCPSTSYRVNIHRQGFGLGRVVSKQAIVNQPVSGNPTHTFTGLIPSTSYRIGIIARNEAWNTNACTGLENTEALSGVFSTAATSLSIADVTGAESGNLRFTITATPVPTSNVTFKYKVTAEGSDTATAGTDFTAVATPVEASIAANSATQALTVRVTNDKLDEDDETFTVTLSDPGTGVAIPDATATGTITDDDNSPVLSEIADVSIRLGQAVDITATATDADNDTVSYAWTRKTGETTPAVPQGTDLSAARLMFTPPAEGTYTMTVTASDGNGNSDTEEVVVTVAKAVTVSVTALRIVEGDTGTYTIKLDSVPSGDVTVTVGGESGDVTVTGSPLTFTTGNYNTAQTITVNAATDIDTTTDADVILTHTATGGGYDSVTIDTVTVSVTEPTTSTTTTTTTTTTVPGKPSGFAGTAGAGSVSLSWTDPDNALITGYQYRQKKGSEAWGAWTDIANSDADTTSHTVTGLDAGVSYMFQTRAKSTNGNSAASDTVTATPTQPSTPTPATPVVPTTTTTTTTTTTRPSTVVTTPTVPAAPVVPAPATTVATTTTTVVRVVPERVGDGSAADLLPVFSACVGDALNDAGFGDVEGLGAEDAINCLAYYGIVVGKSAERFDPGGLVTRSQLALMLHRAAKIAGLDLQGDGATGFDDLEGLGEQRREAIGVLTHHKVLTGVTGSMFEPDRPATRLEIVSALIGFLRLVNPDLFNPDGSLKLAANRIDYFDDTRTDLLQTDDDLVSYAYELGLTTGSAGDRSMFDPDGTVPRKHAAAFITRMLAHTNVRPEGLTAQADGRTIVVSVRDSKFQPVPAQVIDSFYADTSDEAEAFNDQGECTARVNPIKRGTTKCRTDTADPKTDAKGNARLTIPNTAGRNLTTWTWTDKIGITHSNNTTTYKLQLPT